MREAKAVWDEGVAAFKRATSLKQRGAMSAAEFDQAAAVEQVAQAKHVSSLNSVAESLALIGVREAERLIAKQQLADAIIRAPFSGYVQQRDIATGPYVQQAKRLQFSFVPRPYAFVAPFLSVLLNFGTRARSAVDDPVRPNACGCLRDTDQSDAGFTLTNADV